MFKEIIIGVAALAFIKNRKKNSSREEPTRKRKRNDISSFEKRRILEEPSGVGRSWYGGNSGYYGYSMSRRAIEAREEGRYPKTDFKKEYGINDRTLKVLVELGVISDNEWHHTSKYGNKTVFYSWEDDDDIQVYRQNKKQILAWIKTYDYACIAELFSVPYNAFGTENIHIGDEFIIPGNEYIVGVRVVDLTPKYLIIEMTQRLPNNETYNDLRVELRAGFYNVYTPFFS